MTNMKNKLKEEIIDEYKKEAEDVINQNQMVEIEKDVASEAYKELSENKHITPIEVPDEKPGPQKKQKKEKKGLKLPSRVEIFSKIGLSRSGELIGIDIGTSAIKVGVIKKTKEGFELINLARKTYKENLLSDGVIIDDIFVAREIKNIISTNNIKSSIAACALSSYCVIIKKARLPIFEEKGITTKKSSKLVFDDTALIEAEIENAIPFPLKEINYSYHVLGLDKEDENFVNVLFVAAKKEIIDGFVNTFREAGLNLVMLDIDILSLINLVEQAYGYIDSPNLIVDIGASVMNMAIVKGESIEFTREIMLGGRFLTEQIEKALKIPFEEAEKKKIEADPEITYLFEDFIFNISSEINKTINFYLSTKPNETISKIYMTGGCSLLAGLKEKVYEDTNTEVEMIDPFILVGGKDIVRADIYKEYRDFSAISMQLSTRIDDIVR